jgi:hypothetical protein
MAARKSSPPARKAPTRAVATQRPALAKLAPKPVKRQTAPKAAATRTAAATKRTVRPSVEQTIRPGAADSTTLAIANLRLEVYHQLSAQPVRNNEASGAPETDTDRRTRAAHLVDWALGLAQSADTTEQK